MYELNTDLTTCVACFSMDIILIRCQSLRHCEHDGDNNNFASDIPSVSYASLSMATNWEFDAFCFWHWSMLLYQSTGTWHNTNSSTSNNTEINKDYQKQIFGCKDFGKKPWHFGEKPFGKQG